MKGSQEPRIRIEPERAASDGADAALLMETYGNKLHPWQESVVNCWLGRDEDGEFTVTSAGLSVPRQNGKNVCVEAREFYGLTILGERILHTAHQVRTSKRSFRRLAAMFEDKRYPEIISAVKQIRRTNGEESIELRNGGTIEYASRSRQSARGIEGISLVIFDEAQELTDDQMESIMAVLAASATGTRQIIYTGTPPYPSCPGTVFRRRRRNTIEAPGSHDAWHEWSVAAESLDMVNTDDRDLWYMTNPGLGAILTEEFTEEEYRTETKDGFARERLGWWAPVIELKQETAISKEVWDACRSTAKKPEGKTAYGIKFTADGSEVCLCGAVCPADGPARITLIERRPTGLGTRWLSEWLIARYKEASCVVIDGRNGVDVLVDRITDTWRAKNSVIRPKAREVVAAVSLLMDELNSNTVTWYYKQDSLRQSALTVTQRPISGGWGFGGDDPAPIEACSLALWGARTSKRDPAKKMRIG